METGIITLKWGTLKAWDIKCADGEKLLNKYFKLGSSLGAAQQKDNPEQKEIICKLIDLCDDPEGIFLDWDGKYVTKEEAKKYVLEYSK